MKKRLLSLALVLCMVLTLMPMAAFATDLVDSGTCGEKLTWTLDSEGTLTISGTGEMDNYGWSGEQPWYEVNDKIKQVIIENGVTTIGNSAFEYCSSLTKVTIPDSVTTIGNSAFRSCSSLTKVTIPDSVTTIGNSAFRSCSSLISVSIPNSVTTIGDGAFSSCSSLTSVSIPDSVSSIGEYAFSWCNSLTGVSIPNSVTTIGSSAFYGCSSLTSVSIPDSVTYIGSSAFLDTGYYNDANNWEDGILYIGKYLIAADEDIESAEIKAGTRLILDRAFYWRSRLTSVSIPNSVTTIGDDAFYGCNSLTSVSIPNSVTTIGANAFHDCYSLASVSIPNSVTSIEGGTFAYCSSLTSVTIPDSVTSIGDYAFRSCSSLASVSIPDSVTSIGDEAFSDTGYYNDANNWEDGILYLGKYLIAADEDIESAEIKAGTKLIVASVFEDCSSLSSVSIPDSVTSIGDYAFRSCSSLASVSIPNSVATIGDSAFMDCSSLTSVSIPNSVTTIGGWAFSGCSSLTSVSIPDSVTSIGSGVFSYCISMTSISVEDSNKNYCDVDGVLFNKNKTELVQYPCGRIDESYIVPDSVTSIRNSAFSGCSSLINVEISENTTDIGDCAFNFCNKLKSIDVSQNNANYTSADGTLYTKNMTCLITYPLGREENICYIPSSVTYIAYFAFEDAKNLTAVAMPKSVEGIGVAALSGCENMADIYYSGTEDTWKSISIGYDNDGLYNAKIHYVTAEVTEATCTEKGYTTYTCPDCDYNHVDEYIDPLDHDYGEWKQTTAPSCTEKGEETCCCNRCGATETREIETNGHNYKDGVCTVCGAKDPGYKPPKPIHTHDYTAAVTAPTCTEKGYTTYTCECGESYKDNYVDALGHKTEVKNAKAATCTAEGYTGDKVCTACNTVVEQGKVIAALGHNYADGVCTVCGAKDPDYKPPEPDHTHDYIATVTAPTCTEKGYTTYTCTCGDSYKDNYVEAFGHNYKDGVCTVCGEKDPEYKPPVKENPFVDVSETAVYYDAVIWASENEITSGYGNNDFRPQNPCTRAQVVTFLWRAAGCPEPMGDTSIFKDAESIAAPFQKAVAWAVEKGITAGFNDGTFRPNDPVTRAQFVTFLWRYEGQPATTGSINGFADAASIATPYQSAVAWAVGKGITTGYNDNTFRPNDVCTRWAVVLFMYRDMK